MKLGIYQHYKGQQYEVLGVARDTDTLKEKVIYRALYDSPEFGPNAWWSRDRAEFESLVTIDGKTIDRFKLVSE